jgi:ParB family chromosome partitioning protein
LINQDYELIAGYRRYKAAKKLGWQTIDVKIIDVKDKKKRVLIELEENQARRNFTAEEIEKAKKMLSRYNRNGFFYQLWISIIEFFQNLFGYWK